MDWLKSKTAIAGGCLAALVGLQGYGLMSVRGTLTDRIGTLESEIQTMQTQDNAKMSQLASDLELITQRMGITAQELQQAHALATQLKQENARTAQRLRTELAAKADTKAVTQFREEATTKLNEVQQDATTKIGAVTGEVQVVRTDLDATRTDLRAAREDLINSRKDITDVKSQVAHNAGELAELRRKGERDYIEFNMAKSGVFQRIGGVGVQVKKADSKNQKYTVMIQADDERFEKKDRAANEPITFLVGRDRLRYEFVVNFVDKDRIRGYLSTPKDKALSAEGPIAGRLR